MRLTYALTLCIALAIPMRAHARQSEKAPAQTAGPRVGDVAPDFSLPASTKDGALADPIHLSGLKGQVVVLAFFPKARTSG